MCSRASYVPATPRITRAVSGAVSSNDLERVWLLAGQGFVIIAISRGADHSGRICERSEMCE